MKTETGESPTPTEVLIPEARRHQRRRYKRGGAFVVIAALVVGAAAVSALLLWRGPAAGGKPQSDPKPVGVAHSSGRVYFRPVLCFAAAYDTPSGTAVQSATPARGSEPVPACAATARLSAASMDVAPASGSPTGYSRVNIPPDPRYASYPSTSVQKPGYASSTVLLPGLNGACDGAKALRCVLGPAEMSSRLVAKATATQSQTGQWIVDYTMTTAGSALWDKVAQQNFHQILGIEVDGVVYTAPLMQPTQSSFSSFDGRGELGGNLNRSEAMHLVRALTTHKG